MVKVSKVRKVFTSPGNLENARIVAKEAGFSESDGIFILEGKVEGKRSFDDLVCSVKEPAKDYAKPVGEEALAYLLFSSGTTGPPKGKVFPKPTTCHLARADDLEFLAVMMSHKNIMSSVMQELVMEMAAKAVAPVSSSIRSGCAHADERRGFLFQLPQSDCIPVTLITMPFYHSYGLNVYCLRGFARPSTLIVMPKWDVKLALNLIPKYVHRLFMYSNPPFVPTSRPLRQGGR